MSCLSLNSLIGVEPTAFAVNLIVKFFVKCVYLAEKQILEPIVFGADIVYSD
jgi:hypothetical protein